MKVLEFGPRRVRCLSCNSLLQFDISDVEHNNTPTLKNYITCPVCGKVIPLPDRAIYHVSKSEIAN